MYQIRRTSRAFTLIELIVVVIIIGVLAAIAAVAYTSFVSRSRNQAMQASALVVARQIGALSAQGDKTPSSITVDNLTTGGASTTNVTVEKSVTTTKFYVLNNVDRTKATRYACINASSPSDTPGSIGAITLYSKMPATLPTAPTAAQKSGTSGNWDAVTGDICPTADVTTL